MGTTRVIFDTNVLISALGFSGKPEQCLDLVRNGELTLFRSPETMGELARVLHYTPEDVRREVIEDEDYYFIRVPQGKDTTGSGGKPRDAYLPREVERDLHRYQRAENITQTDSVIDVSPRTVQRIVKSAAARAADRTGDDDFRKVSTHDLRRYFTHSCLVRERMNPRVVMEIGGWDNYQALELYLNKPSTETIVSEFSRASMV